MTWAQPVISGAILGLLVCFVWFDLLGYGVPLFLVAALAQLLFSKSSTAFQVEDEGKIVKIKEGKVQVKPCCKLVKLVKNEFQPADRWRWNLLDRAMGRGEPHKPWR